MDNSILVCLFVGFFTVLTSGNIISVKVHFNVFTVLEGETFQITCSASHRDRKPEIQWYHIDSRFIRTNLTDFISPVVFNQAFTTIHTLTRSSARLSYSGDYYCLAKIGDSEQERVRSSGVPIMVITEKNMPKVKATRKISGSSTTLTCKVIPIGRGILSWRRGGKILEKNEGNEVKLTTSTHGKYSCVGNVTLGGYRYFSSSVEARATASWSHMAAKTSLLCSLFMTLFVFFIA
ncbi:uncharacterized protein LOC124448025 [Xenia sp. Carnegie-2017]|uniref:uncharacterized protein LOC124448025 n=1 Tax=Xenia sp. Carnegie-2017 TaxID=2897299 RepID=UPI001F0378FA|nr:uncharacterized protein LOC124448025 [Xenia sp. Carnegie-2017]